MSIMAVCDSYGFNFSYNTILFTLGQPVPDDINVVCYSRRKEIAVAAGNIVYIFARGKVVSFYASLFYRNLDNVQN